MRSILTSWADASGWLAHQASLSYVWDQQHSYFRVAKRWRFAGYGPYTEVPVSPKFEESFAHSQTWCENHPNLSNNIMFRDWRGLSPLTRNKIASFFEARDLTDFDFFDHGGRAMIFLATEQASGKRRIARIEADHHFRSIRPRHPSVLQALHSNEDALDHYERIKLEIVPEIVPLHKMPARDESSAEPDLSKAFHEASYHIGYGTNLTYHGVMFDRDPDPPNVGILPDGRVVSLDPEFIFGQDAENHYRYLIEGETFRPLLSHAGELYGLRADAAYF